MKTQETPGKRPRRNHLPPALGPGSGRRTMRRESPPLRTGGTRPWHLFLAVLLAGTAACSESPTENGGADGDPDGAAALHVDAARGSDANAGTREAPFATIDAGIQRAASGQEIRVAGGSYPQAITLRSGLRIMGGYDGSNWQRTDAATFVGAGSVAVSGSNVSDVVLDGLIIQSADVSDAGVSSVALRLENSTGITIRSSRLLSGQGGNGTAGSAGGGGNGGSGGSAGQLPVACFPGVTREGGAGGGSSFAPGGAGGIGSTVDGGNGSRGGGNNGGDGGTGGVRVGSAGPHGTAADAGAAGTRGENGRAGLPFGTASGAAYQAADGDDGTAGTNGSGGGGGGGGAGAVGGCGSSGGGVERVVREAARGTPEPVGEDPSGSSSPAERSPSTGSRSSPATAASAGQAEAVGPEAMGAAAARVAGTAASSEPAARAGTVGAEEPEVTVGGAGAVRPSESSRSVPLTSLFSR
jgi:hypothetical protein